MGLWIGQCSARLGWLGSRLQLRFRSALLVFILGPRFKEQLLSGGCCQGNRGQKFKSMSRNVEFLLNPSLGPGTMSLLLTFYCSKQVTWPSPKSVEHEIYGIIKSNYLGFFFLVLCIELLKHLEFYCPLYVSEVTQRERVLCSFRMGIGYQKNQLCEYRARTFSSMPQIGTRCWGLSWNTNV